MHCGEFEFLRVARLGIDLMHGPSCAGARRQGKRVRQGQARVRLGALLLHALWKRGRYGRQQVHAYGSGKRESRKLGPARLDCLADAACALQPCSGGICHCGQQLRGCPDKSYCQMPGRNKLDIDRNTCKRNVPKQPQSEFASAETSGLRMADSIPHAAFTGELGSSCGAGASVDCKQGLWCYLETGDMFDLANNTCISEE